MKKNFKLQSDKYRKARGGYSRLLRISCESCGHEILLYQKDGAGILKRLYFDRIFAVKSLTNLKKSPINKTANLQCQKCRSVVGIPFIYKKENRGAFRLFAGAIKKKLISSFSAQTKEHP